MQLIFGITLSYYLRCWHVSEYALAELMFIDRSHVRRIVDGEKLPSPHAFPRLYGALLAAALVVNPNLLKEDAATLQNCFHELFGAWSHDMIARGDDRHNRRLSA